MHLFQVAPNTGSQVSGFLIVNVRKKHVSSVLYFLYFVDRALRYISHYVGDCLVCLTGIPGSHLPRLIRTR